MLSVALTGNVASGKSTVAARWASAGIPLISADDLAREAVEPGTDGLAEIVAEFGEDVLEASGGLDRAAMRERVFGDEAARERLEAILHPKIRRLRDRWMADQRARGAALVVAEIPLLFETGYHSEFDETVVVHAREDVRRDRLVRLRGLDEDTARRIMQSQMDPARKLELADHVLRNDGDRKELEQAADALLGELRRRAAGVAS